jgi:hypothetical protein
MRKKLIANNRWLCDEMELEGHERTRKGLSTFFAICAHEMMLKGQQVQSG